MNYQACLDHIFSSYMEKKASLKGKKYQDYKNTKIFKALLEKLELTPDLKKVIRITGSKGKGSTARTLAHLLSSKMKVGLLVSPEELEHTDRIQIGNGPISEEKFVEHYNKIAVQMEQVALGKDDYFSPYGLFLLIGLSWFKEQSVDFIVLECGRGVRFDDSSEIASEYGVVTSILPEHLDYFGPDCQAVWHEKSALLENSNMVFMPDSLKTYSDDKKINWVKGIMEGNYPRTYATSAQLAKEVAKHILKEEIDSVELVSSSFGHYQLGGKDLYFDGLIHHQGIDADWIASLENPPLFLVSLPDDKDIEGVTKFLNDHYYRASFIKLEGKRGYLDYQKTDGPSFHFNDGLGFKRYWLRHPAQTIVFWGTQTFLRLFKNSFYDSGMS